MAHVKLPSSPGLDVDCTSDVRIRIQQSSYIQEQYVLTRCSLSSERSLQTQSHSHINTSSNSDSAAGAFLPDPHSSAPLLDTGSLPQGLEKVPPAGHRSSLSRWADSAWQQNLSAETSTDNSAEIVRLKVMKSPKSKYQVLNWFQSGTTISLQGKPSLWRKIKIACLSFLTLFGPLFNQAPHPDGGEESRRRHKALTRSTMAARSFSSPQGELEMHRLRRALERVSFDQTLGGRLDESDGETKPPSRGTLSRRSLTDSSTV